MEIYNYNNKTGALLRLCVRMGAILANVKEGKVFEKAEETAWKCRNCGHVHYGKNAPEICPVCAHAKAHFEVRSTNY